MDRLRELQQKHQIIGDVRGRGLMIGIELVRDRVTKERATTERDKIVDACFKRGLLLLGAGKNAIRISPPLVLTKAQADDRGRIIDAAIAESARERRRASTLGRHSLLRSLVTPGQTQRSATSRCRASVDVACHVTCSSPRS